MPGRDVEIRLVGRDDTGHATRSAANNLDRLARKVDKFNAGDLSPKKGKVDVDTKSAAKSTAKLKRTFADAGTASGRSFRDRLRRFIGPSGFDRDFSRSVRNVPNIFRAAGRRAGSALRKEIASGPGFDAEFVRGVNRVTTLFSRSGVRARAAFRRALADGPGFDAQFTRDLSKISAAFSRAGARSRTAFQTALGRLKIDPVRAKIRQVFRVDRDARHNGITAGSTFFRAFINTVTFGMAGGQLSAGMIKAAPKMAAVGTALGAVVAGALVLELAQALAAASSLIIGGGLLAGPIAFMLVQNAKAAKETEKQEKRVASLRKRLSNATNKDTQARLRKELAAEERILAELQKKSQQWDSIKAKAKSFMDFISAPLAVPLQKSIDAMFQGLKNLQGPVREVMAALGTALPGLTEGVFAGFLSFINALKPALPAIVTGLNEWGRVMPQITGSIGGFLAKISSQPAAVQGFADSFDTIVGTLGDVIVRLEEAATTYGRFEALIRGGRTRQWGTEWTKLDGVVGKAARGIAKAQLTILTKYDDFLQKIKAVPGSPFAKYQAEVHTARVAMEAEFNKMIEAKNKVDTAFAGAPSIAQLDADDTDFKAKIINAKKQLKTVKSEKARVRIQADLSQWRLARATIRADKHVIQKSTKTVLRGDAKDLKTKIAQMKRDIKNLPKEKRFEAKARIAAAEAALRRLQGEINQLHGKHVDIWIKTHRVTYYGTKGKVPTNPKAGSGAPGSGPSSSGFSWNASLSGGTSHRTAPPTVNVAAPEVSTRVIIDGRDIRFTARQTVIDENRRAAYRARVGRRP